MVYFLASLPEDALSLSCSCLNNDTMDTRRFDLLQHGMPGAYPLPASLRLKWLAAQEGQRSTISLEMIESRLEAASQKRRV